MVQSKRGNPRFRPNADCRTAPPSAGFEVRVCSQRLWDVRLISASLTRVAPERKALKAKSQEANNHGIHVPALQETNAESLPVSDPESEQAYEKFLDDLSLVDVDSLLSPPMLDLQGGPARHTEEPPPTQPCPGHYWHAPPAVAPTISHMQAYVGAALPSGPSTPTRAMPWANPPAANPDPRFLPNADTRSDAEGQQPEPLLHVAMRSRNRAVVQVLLQRGAVAVDERDVEGRTALHIAAGLGDGAMIGVLLANGADTQARDVRGHLALYYAVEQGHCEVVERLLDGADTRCTQAT